eukprot:5369820-Prymnesium_polylepis.1
MGSNAREGQQRHTVSHLEHAATIGSERPSLLMRMRGALVLVEKRTGVVAHLPPAPQQFSLPHGTDCSPCSARISVASLVPKLMM